MFSGMFGCDILWNIFYVKNPAFLPISIFIEVKQSCFLNLPYILESNPHPVFATFLNEKKLVRASNPHLSFNRPLPTDSLFE
jgi:hypothetical protein